MFIKNLAAEASDYYTQNNNRFIPMESCGPESAAMALDLAGVQYFSPKIMQRGDYITATLNSKIAWEKFRTEQGWAYEKGLRPHNVSSMLAWGINYIVGQEVDVLREDVELTEILWYLIQEHPLIMSGPFTKSGHFVVVTGFASYQHFADLKDHNDIDLKQVQYIMVSDPHGDYHTGYQSPNGWNVMFSVKEFNNLTNTPGNLMRKRVHIIGYA